MKEKNGLGLGLLGSKFMQSKINVYKKICCRIFNKDLGQFFSLLVIIDLCNLLPLFCLFSIVNDLRIDFILLCQVEEIDDVDGNSSDPFVAAAIANEKDLDLSEEQKKNFRKVNNFFF